MDSKPSLQIFGSIDSPGGELLVSRGGFEGAAMMGTHILRTTLQKWGHEITPAIEAALVRKETERVEEMKAEMRARGVPDNLKQLMAATSKREATRLASAMTLTQSGLATLAYNHDQIGCTYRVKHLQSAPPHVIPSEAEILAVFNSRVGNRLGPDALKTIRKADALQRERRCVSAHMFENVDGWHLFYLSYEDGFELPWKVNHWKHGPHVHYSSNLFTQRSRDEIWAALDKRKFTIPGEHIRFDSNRRQTAEAP